MDDNGKCQAHGVMVLCGLLHGERAAITQEPSCWWLSSLLKPSQAMNGSQWAHSSRCATGILLASRRCLGRFSNMSERPRPQPRPSLKMTVAAQMTYTGQSRDESRDVCMYISV